MPTDRVWSVFEDAAGEVLAVTVNGPHQRSISILEGGRFRTVAFPPFNGRATWAPGDTLLQSHTGEWWAATSQGLCRYDPMRAADLAGRQPRICYSTDVIYRVFEDSKGAIWASAQSARGDQLMRWDPRTGSVFHFPAPKFPGAPIDDLVSVFAEDRQGNIWMGLLKGGVYRYDGREFRLFQHADGVPGGAIFALLADESGLWIGSNGGGLGHIANTGDAHPRVDVYSTARGLASNIIACLVEDRQGRLYAGTGRGVDRLDAKSGHIHHFSVADGLAHGEFKAAMRDRSGSLWFATAQGLSRLTPEPERPAAKPRVLITDLRIGGAPYPLSQFGESYVSPRDLQPSENQLQVEFVGLDYEPGDVIRYTSKLEGADRGWSPPRSQHSVNYAALAPGHYRFLVKAVTSDGQESANPAEIEFTVVPPLWKRWWFQCLTLAVASAAVLTAHRYRVAQAVSLERMRTAIATDLHDDIGATLSQIAIVSEVARVNGNGQGHPADTLERVAAVARELVDSMSDIVWSIRAEPGGIDSLVRRMREFALDLLAPQGIEFELRRPQPNGEPRFTLQARRELFLMFKECIHNAARHSRCTAVSAALEIDGRVNGGTGIEGMRLRAGNLGGHMEMTSEPGRGCTVIIRLPMRRGVFSRTAR